MLFVTLLIAVTWQERSYRRKGLLWLTVSGSLVHPSGRCLVAGDPRVVALGNWHLSPPQIRVQQEAEREHSDHDTCAQSDSCRREVSQEWGKSDLSRKRCRNCLFVWELSGTQLGKSWSFANAKEDWARLCLKEKQESEHDSVKMSPDPACPKVSSCRLLILK